METKGWYKPKKRDVKLSDSEMDMLYFALESAKHGIMSKPYRGQKSQLKRINNLQEKLKKVM